VTRANPNLEKQETKANCRVTGSVKVGTCGFGLAQAGYGRAFSCVEVQHTFYQPPKLTTLERWRSLMPDDFEFALKAWQLITHDAKSPTYRRLKQKLSESERQAAGYFRDTNIVREAWEITLASAEALQAKTILFQCPASFTPTRENISNLKKFFGSIERRDLNLCWEPRGDWADAEIKSICSKLGLWHGVDPFVRKTVTPEKCYFRLHGRNGWRYRYEDGELQELSAQLPQRQAAYVFFNNRNMTEDAMRFCKIIASTQQDAELH
jgi:uncharacterized protein YecE (DUF72 family)